MTQPIGSEGGWAMLVIQETTTDGSVQMWEAKVEECPDCGGECTVEYPRTPDTPMRALCWQCSYSEGYTGTSG